MAAQGRSGAFIVTVLIIFFSIINLGIGIGVTARYNQYGDVFRQPVGLAAFSIVVGLFGLVVGALSLLSIRQESSSLSKYFFF
jgi:ABC-type transport system involved in multi-copper enzyme maturation permease subunit